MSTAIATQKNGVLKTILHFAILNSSQNIEFLQKRFETKDTHENQLC